MEDPWRPRNEDEDACGKFWEIYLNEAQRYDEGLIKSWKEDMDVTLVFSGLYSAVLTAFVIQSYQELQPDQTELSAKYLERIFQQLSGAANITAPPGAEAYSPATSAIACNILWFMSLTLALTCAFLATFVQQWARHFLHRTTILRSSTARARLLQFLYFGLKEMRMHTMVDVIPSLLHISLFFFLAGLVAFLIDVNAIVAWLMLSVLCIVVSMYMTFTVLPLFKLNSPFQTPLSQFAWRLRGQFTQYLRKLKSLGKSKPRRKSRSASALQQLSNFRIASDITDPEAAETPLSVSQLPLSPRNKRPEIDAGENLIDAMILASRSGSPTYESASASWVLKSLNDDVELLPFVEALSDVLYGPEGLRSRNLHIIRPLLYSPDFHSRVIPRIHSLMINCSQSWFTEMHKKRCLTACPKLLWILAIVTIPKDSALHQTSDIKDRRTKHFPISSEILRALEEISITSPSPYMYSAIALCTLQVYYTCKIILSAPVTYQELRGIRALVENCPPPSFQPHLYNVRLHRDELLQNVEERMSGLFGHFLWVSCETFPYEFGCTVSVFQSCGITLRVGDTEQVYWKLPICLTNAASDDIDTNPHRIPPRIQQLDSIFKVAFNSSDFTTEWLLARADPTFYITHRVIKHGWKSTASIWNYSFTWDTRFFDRLKLLRVRSCLDMINFLQELLFCLSPIPHQNEQLHADFWSNTLSGLDVSIPEQNRLKFCIRIMAVVGVKMSNSHFSNLDQIVQDARRHIASDETIRALVPDITDKESLETIPFLLLLKLFQDLEHDAQYNLHTALLYYCSSGTYPVPLELIVMAPAPVGVFANHTRRLTEQWLDDQTSMELEILYLVFEVWSKLMGRINSVSEHATVVSQLLPLLESIKILLSPTAREVIEETLESPEWKIRERKMHRLSLSVRQLYPIIEWCRTSLEFFLPYAIPLPDPSEDETADSRAHMQTGIPNLIYGSVVINLI